MKQEQIFELAESNGYQDDFGRWNFTDEQLLDFVHEILIDEREACARVCDDWSEAAGVHLAATIRARGEA